MPENNTHSTEDAAEIQERRNYVAYQGIQLEVRAAAEGEESRTIGGNCSGKKRTSSHAV